MIATFMPACVESHGGHRFEVLEADGSQDFFICFGMRSQHFNTERTISRTLFRSRIAISVDYFATCAEKYGK